MTTLQIAVRDDLVKIGVGEDGDDVIARCLYLVAENAAGSRWAHDRYFADCVQAYDPREGAYHQRRPIELVESEVEALRRKVEAHLAAGGRLDQDHWYAIDPAYGSAAYQGLDAVGYFRGRERQEARDAGESVPFDGDLSDWAFHGLSFAQDVQRLRP